MPKQIEENGLEKDDVRFDRKAIARIIGEYTQEAGFGNSNARSARSAESGRKKAEMRTEISRRSESRAREP